MSALPPSQACAEALARSERLAQARGEPRVSPMHVLLAIMCQVESQWPRRIVERGGLTFRLALRRLGWHDSDDLRRAASSEVCIYRPSMRMMLIVLVASSTWLIFRVRRTTVVSVSTPPHDLATTKLIALAERYATLRRSRDAVRQPELDVGHLLLALASTPGSHLRLLDNGTLLACAVRRDLGLDRWHHRLVLACDIPSLMTRRIRMRLDRGVAANGRLSVWGLARAIYSTLGAVFALAVFPVIVLTSLLFYIFLWPAAILIDGVRTLCAMFAGCDTTSHRWQEIPGGEIALTGSNTNLSGRRLTTLVLAPRIVAFTCGITTMAVVIWRSQRLGIAISPTLYSRPDILTGASHAPIWLMPFVVFHDVLTQNGTWTGIGLLAGLGAAVMSFPTYREIELIRLYDGHEAGLGSSVARAITLPASVIAGAAACAEAVFPFFRGPISLIAYIVPLALSVLLAAAIASIMPY
jgi:hypothetical protein